MNIEYLKPQAGEKVNIDGLGSAAERVGRENSSGEKQISEPGAEDRLTISPEAQELLRADKELQQKALEAPSLRQDRIDLARDRIQSGFYTRDDVMGKIVDTLLGVEE
mgnify:CR=1 FL=1